MKMFILKLDSLKTLSAYVAGVCSRSDIELDSKAVTNIVNRYINDYLDLGYGEIDGRDIDIFGDTIDEQLELQCLVQDVLNEVSELSLEPPNVVVLTVLNWLGDCVVYTSSNDVRSQHLV